MTAITFASLALLAFVSQFVHVKTFTSGASSVSQLQQESNYRDTYKRDMLQVQRDSAPFLATASVPGVCNKGGTKQGCYDTDEKVIKDLRATLADLRALPVPERFATADPLLKQGLQADIDGLSLRDQAIASGNPNASFDASNAKLSEAEAALKKAYGLYPSDSRLSPLP